jgi:hypothetical protein
MESGAAMTRKLRLSGFRLIVATGKDSAFGRVFFTFKPRYSPALPEPSVLSVFSVVFS